MKIFAIPLTVFLIFGSFSVAHSDPLEVTEAYARASRPGAPTGAVFMVLTNVSDTEVKVTGASSPAAKITQLHSTTEDDDGVMRMREIENGVTIPPGESFAFKRGGDHIMLMGLTHLFKPGEDIEIMLKFEAFEPQTIVVPVAQMRQIPKNN